MDFCGPFINIWSLLSQFPNSLFYGYIPSNKNTTSRCLCDSAENNQKSKFGAQKQVISCCYAFFAILSFKFKSFTARDGRPTKILGTKTTYYVVGKCKYFLPLNTVSLYLLFCTKHSSEISTKPKNIQSGCQPFLSLLSSDSSFPSTSFCIQIIYL